MKLRSKLFFIWLLQLYWRQYRVFTIPNKMHCLIIQKKGNTGVSFNNRKKKKRKKNLKEKKDVKRVKEGGWKEGPSPLWVKRGVVNIMNGVFFFPLWTIFFFAKCNWNPQLKCCGFTNQENYFPTELSVLF